MAVVPRVSTFYGIDIEMYFEDHPPPHFHARYGGDEALIVIETGEVYAGKLPRRAMRLVQQWRELHRVELAENFKQAIKPDPIKPIEPLP